MEPFFRATTPDGRISVVVAVPVGSEEAEAVLFKCAVTVLSESLNVVTVIEELETNDPNKMLNWMQRQMTEAMRRNTAT